MSMVRLGQHKYQVVPQTKEITEMTVGLREVQDCATERGREREKTITQMAADLPKDKFTVVWLWHGSDLATTSPHKLWWGIC